MFKPGKVSLTLLLGATLAVAMMAQAARAEQAVWRASKTTGEVWITHSGVQPVALSNDEAIAPGDVVRTGRNGRVLLSRGEETILVSANAQLEIAPNTTAAFSTILQTAGSILLEVEKRNVQHFEVKTPYLAAVVKGTKFRVTVEHDASNVEVLRGQVEVTDYRSGQIALVNPGQAAAVSAHGPSGLALTGSGALNPIQPGTPSAAPREFAPQPNGLPTVPERHADAARETLRSTPQDLSAPTTSHKIGPGASGMAADAGGASAGPERQSSNAPSASNDGASDFMLSGLVNWLKESVAGGRGMNRNEDVAETLTIPATVGVAVALGVGVMRRRKRVKAGKDRG